MNKSTQEFIDDVKYRLAQFPNSTKSIGTYGFLELEDTWGDESTIINTARISSSNRRVSMDSISDKDEDLLYFLLKHHHGTPFETVYFRFRIIAPIFVLRQWVKHRISSWNEFSMRYRNPMDIAYIPDSAALKVDGYSIMKDDDMLEYSSMMENAFSWYDSQYAKVSKRIDEDRINGIIPEKVGGRDPYKGRAREVLRNIIPVAAYSDVYWTINFRSLMNFFNLRMKESAQYEIRQYANAAFELFSHKYPLLSATMTRVLEEENHSE